MHHPLATAPRISSEAQTYRTEQARELSWQERKAGITNPGVPYDAVVSFKAQQPQDQLAAIDRWKAKGRPEIASYFEFLMRLQKREAPREPTFEQGPFGPSGYGSPIQGDRPQQFSPFHPQ